MGHELDLSGVDRLLLFLRQESSPGPFQPYDWHFIFQTFDHFHNGHLRVVRLNPFCSPVHQIRSQSFIDPGQVGVYLFVLVARVDHEQQWD